MHAYTVTMPRRCLETLEWLNARGYDGNFARLATLEEDENGTFAVGTLAEVERKAREIAASELWSKSAAGRETRMRITRGSRQYFVKCVVLP